MIEDVAANTDSTLEPFNPHDGTHDHPEHSDPSLFDASLYSSADGLAGSTAANGKPIWTATQAAEYLFRAGAGYGVGANMVMPTSGTVEQLNFGFHTSQQSLWDNGYVYRASPTATGLSALSEYFNFKPFTDAQMAATREAVQYWDDVVSTQFVETHINNADVAFGNYTNQPGTQAYARLLANAVTSNTYINEQIRDIGGDVWVNFNTASNFQLDEGGYGMNTLVHEVGHGFGMLHPGDYNASPGVSLSYKANAEYYQDTRSYSILSYWNPRDIGARDFDWTRMNIAYGATPMVHDILAMQLKYGADMTTRTGDTVYGFNSNAGRDAFDFVLTPAPMMTIWDAGGIDTLDASGYGTSQVIDLNPGALSSIGGITAAQFPTFDQVNANRAAANMAPTTLANYNANKAAFDSNPALYGRITDNVGIAYGAIVENAVGGSGNDTVLGNNADNVLKGMAGNDLILGGIGNDTLDGDLGDDEMLGGAGMDQLFGGAGDDRLIGGEGRDFLTGGLGIDTFVAEINSDTVTGRDGKAISTDTILDFVSGQDKIDLSALGLTTGKIVGYGANKNAGDVSFRVFTSVHGAETALGFDIDGQEGASSFTGPVTVVYINKDGGSIDAALALIGTNGVTANDFAAGGFHF